MLPIIKTGEKSFDVYDLHKIMPLLRLQVDADEFAQRIAGSKTKTEMDKWKKDNQIDFDRNLVIDKNTSIAIDKFLKAKGHLAKDKTNIITVKVSHDNKKPIPKVKLWALDLNFKTVSKYKSYAVFKELLELDYLGDSVSDENGKAEIMFHDYMLTKSTKNKIDIVIIATQANKIITRSDELSFKETVNRLVELTVATPKSKLTEFVDLDKKLNPILEKNDIKLSELDASDDLVNYVAKKAEISIEKIHARIFAEQLNSETDKKLTPELTYGLMMQNVSLDWEMVYQSSGDVIENALKRAIEEKQIKRTLNQNIQDYIEDLKTVAAEKILEPKNETPNTFNELLSLSLQKHEDKIQFAKIKAEFRDTDQKEFWNTFLPENTSFSKTKIQALQTHQELFEFSGFYLPLVREVSKTGVKTGEEMAKWDRAKVEASVKKSGVPESTKGNSEQEKIKNYARAIQKAVHRKYTTAVVKHKIENDEFKITDATVRQNAILFLSTDKDFDIKEGITDRHGQIEQIAGENADATIDQMNEIVRISRISDGDMTNAQILKDNEITRARKIANFSKDNFIHNHGDKFDNPADAEDVWGEAVRIEAKVDVAAQGWLAHNDISGAGSGILYEITRPLETTAENKLFAGFSRAFNVSLCECQHCNSVYSPAAYFVDLMQYLAHGKVNDAGKSPLDVLKKRRPDICHCPLSCENSHTLIPFIDLCNEVMEGYIFYTSADLSPDQTLIDDFKSEDTGDLSPEELRAQPQHIRKEVYQKLSEVIFPLNMPFTLPLEILRAYSHKMGTSWFEIQNVLIQTDTEISKQFLRNTYLQLSKGEDGILVDNDNANLHKYYGLESSTELSSELYKVPVFLKQAGLDYVELVELFKTRFINPVLYRLNYLDFLFVHTDLTTREIYQQLDSFRFNPTITSLSSELIFALKAEGLEFDEFRRWILDNFDSLKNSATLYEKKSRCNIENSQIRTIQYLYSGRNLISSLRPIYRRLHTFIRLWRKTDWSIEELDAILIGLKIRSLEQENLNNISYAKQFIDESNLSPKHAAVLWGDLDYRAENNLYAELFLNHSLEIHPFFIPVPDKDLFENARQLTRRLGESVSTRLGQYTADLMAVFKLAEQELEDIYSIADINKANDITIAQISMVYRYVLFAKACDIPVSELLQLIRIFELNPFDGPEQTFMNYQKITDFLSNDYDLPTAGFVVSANILDNTSLMLKLVQVRDLIKTLQNQYEQIDTQKILDENGNELEDLDGIDQARLSLKKPITMDMLAGHFSMAVGSVKALYEHREEDDVTNLENLIVAIQNLSLENENEQILPEPFVIFHRAIKVIELFSFSESEVLYFSKNPEEFNDLDMFKLSIQSWWRLYDYVELRQSLPKTENTLIEILDSANDENDDEAAAENEEYIKLLHRVTKWSKIDIEHVLARAEFKEFRHFTNEIALLKIQKIVQLAQTIGITLNSLYILKAKLGTDTEPDISNNFETLWFQAQQIKRLLKAKYDSSTWQNVATELNDKLREQQRDALVSYLLTSNDESIKDFGVTDANGLYEYLLIDVQMSACMETSRIVQCSAACQQFVNRIHLNLEKEVLVDALDRKVWAWMQHYRLWEANVRIKNETLSYLDPNYRLDKSQFFDEFVSDLTQNDITNRTAEQALRGYLKNMNEVANLNIAGMYEEKDSDGNFVKLHVFGHTNNTPYKCYYRKYNKFNKWSAWETVDVPIQAVSNSGIGSDEKAAGIHLIPVVWKNRLILFWPEFIEKTEEPEIDTELTVVSLQDEDESPPLFQQPKKYWEVRLAWSEYDNSKWTSKNISDQYHKLEFAELDLISFAVAKDQGNSKFEISIQANYPYSRAIGSGSFDIRSAKIQLYEIDLNSPIKIVSNEIYRHNTNQTNTSNMPNLSKFWNYELDGKYEYDFQKTNTVTGPLQFEELYLQNNLNHQLLFPNQLKYLDNPISYPFIFSTSNKNYFVKHAVKSDEILDHISDPSLYRFDVVKKILVFDTFHHPFVAQFISNLNKNGVGSGNLENPGLLESDLLDEDQPEDNLIYDDHGSNFKDFDPDSLWVFEPPQEDLEDPNKTFFKETVDFDPYGANSYCNWELFFHCPMFISIKLMHNGQFREAFKWIKYIFDPTTSMPTAPSDASDVARFFNFRPFKTVITDSFEKFIYELASNAPESRGNDIVNEWRENPFDPHRVASNFPVKYMKQAILVCAEICLEWADSKYRRFTRENVFEALQLYVIAKHILGPNPQSIPKPGVIRVETYASIENKLDDLSNALVTVENEIPHSSGPASKADKDNASSFLGMGSSLYFCIPPNDKLMQFWERVDDRCHKIRHCMDINGRPMRLALFAPRIGPAALIKARAAGLDIEDIINEISSPAPHYRFSYLLQKANECLNDVKSLSSGLLTAIEKKDNEALVRIRTTHETGLLKLAQEVRERQVLEAKNAIELLNKQRETAIYEFNYYNETLLGNEPVEIPSVLELEAGLDSDSQLTFNPDLQEIVPDIDVSIVDSDEQGLKISSKEILDITLRESADLKTSLANSADIRGSFKALLPDISANAQPWGIGLSTSIGGSLLSKVDQMVSSSLRNQASSQNQRAGLASTIASLINREQDRTHLMNLKLKQICLNEREIIAGEIRLQITEKELENHKQQIRNSEMIENYLKDKFSNMELHQWTEDQLYVLQKQSYDLCFELAMQAEKACEFELGEDQGTTFIEYGYYDSSKKGLCAAEKLQLALRKLDRVYHEKNKRKLELTKHISLRQLAPEQLLMLRETGHCKFDMPEALFDMDFPGHYNRRIRSVSCTIPCVTGPYTTIACSLQLESSQARVKPTEGETDVKSLNNVPVLSMATSSGQNDSGMHEFNFRDERYLPFEGAGAISSWILGFPGDKNFRQFDSSTITDCLFHINYTAKEGAPERSEDLRNYYSPETPADAVEPIVPLSRIFDIKSEFPEVWHRLTRARLPEDQTLELVFKAEHFQYFEQYHELEIKKILIAARKDKGAVNYKVKLNDFDELFLVAAEKYGSLYAANQTPERIGSPLLTFDLSKENILNLVIKNVAPDAEGIAMSDLYLVLFYSLKDKQ